MQILQLMVLCAFHICIVLLRNIIQNSLTVDLNVCCGLQRASGIFSCADVSVLVVRVGVPNGEDLGVEDEGPGSRQHPRHP